VNNAEPIMTTGQGFFTLFSAASILLIWGRICYGLVVFGVLVIVVISGFDTPNEAFLRLR
jgi:hypothetical protein